MGSVLALAFGAFIGFEATAIYREEARTPDRTVPRATYIAVGFLGLFYAFISWVIIQGFGNTGAVAAAAKNPAGMFFTAMTTYVGGWATDAMRVLIVTSLFAALLAFHNAITRYTYALASEGALPRRLGHIHPVHKSPYVAGYAQTALAAAVVAGFAIAHADPYLQLLLWVNLSCPLVDQVRAPFQEEHGFVTQWGSVGNRRGTVSRAAGDADARTPQAAHQRPGSSGVPDREEFTADLRTMSGLDPLIRRPGGRVVADVRDVEIVAGRRGVRAVPEHPELLQEGRTDLPGDVEALRVTHDRTRPDLVLLSRRGNSDLGGAFQDHDGLICVRGGVLHVARTVGLASGNSGTRPPQSGFDVAGSSFRPDDKHFALHLRAVHWLHPLERRPAAAGLQVAAPGVDLPGLHSGHVLPPSHRSWSMGQTLAPARGITFL